ncbi:MAG: hypothetical protein QXQ20_08815 [Candidatus Nezhaarchaeales archaeon]
MDEIDREIRNVETVKNVIAHMYLFSSHAYVELGQKFYDMVANAREVRECRENYPFMVEIDGVKYSFWIENDVSVSYYDVSDEEDWEGIEQAIKEEVENLYNEFKKREKDELIAILENSNADFYVFAIITIEKEE